MRKKRIREKTKRLSKWEKSFFKSNKGERKKISLGREKDVRMGKGEE